MDENKWRLEIGASIIAKNKVFFSVWAPKAGKVWVLILLFFPIISSIARGENGDDLSWKSRVELSFVDTTGNTDTQTFSGKVDVQKRKGLSNYFFTGRFLYGVESGDVTSSKFVSETGWEYTVTERLFSTLAIGYLRDKFSGYDYRVYGGPGIGYTFIKSDNRVVEGFISSIYYYDRFFRAGGDFDAYPTAKVRLKCEWKLNTNLKIKEIIDYFISFQDKDKYFIDYDSSIEVRINQSLSLGMTYIINYQNLLPSPDVRHTDTTFLTTLIIDI